MATLPSDSKRAMKSELQKNTIHSTQWLQAFS